MRFLFFVLSLGLFQACGGGSGGDGAAATPTKDITSIWEASDNSVILDLRAATIGTPGNLFILDTDLTTVLCTCTGGLTGGVYSGSYTLDCTTCGNPWNAINVTDGTYSISNSNVANFCDVAGDPNSCAEYQ